GAPEAPRSLLERDEALRAITSAIDLARGGVGGALFLMGEAGVGKSSLIEAARARADDQLTIVEARGSLLERDFPFAYAEQFLGPVGKSLPVAGSGGDLLD